LALDKLHDKNKIIYAILDIETTGGKYNEEGITEIAIYKFDGHAVIDQFISLVNPEREIQPFVVNLTGINKNMLKNAPKFLRLQNVSLKSLKIVSLLLIMLNLITEFSKQNLNVSDLNLKDVHSAQSSYQKNLFQGNNHTA